MFHLFDKAILGMSLMRILSGCIELSVAVAILKFNNIEKALVLNSSLALVGPVILILTTAIGLVGMTERLSIFRIVVIFIGVGLILFGVKAR